LFNVSEFIMRIVTAYDLGVFAAQNVTQQKIAQDAWIKRAADEYAPLDRARPEVSSFVVQRPLDNAGLAARNANIDGLQQQGLNKLYGPSNYTGFRLKPVQHGLSASRVPIVTEYQVVATGPDGVEKVITNIKSTGPQSMANTNPSNINRLVEQAMAGINVQPGPKPRAPRPQAQPKPDPIQEHLNRWADSSKSPTGAPNPNIPPPVPAAPAPAPVAPAAPAPTPMPVPPPPPAPAQPDQIGPTAPITMDNALGGPKGGQPSPPEPEPEAGPNGPNAGNYVPPAAPEPEPISELAPPTMYPRLADEQSIQGQAVLNANAQNREDYNQTLKQRQDVGNNPADYPEQPPAPAQPAYDQKVVDGIFDNIVNPATAYSQKEVDAISDKLRLPATLGTADSILPPSPSVNDLGFADPNYVPPIATPTSDTQPTYGQKGLTKKELATQRSVGNVGAFSQTGVAKTRKEDQRKAKLAPAPATAAPTAPSVPVTPPQPPIPTPDQPKPTPPPVPAPKPEPAPAPTPAVPQYRPSAPAAPAYRPPAQSAPAARPTIGGGLFGRRRR
jgi:hypothetical protein